MFSTLLVFPLNWLLKFILSRLTARLPPPPSPLHFKPCHRKTPVVRKAIEKFNEAFTHVAEFSHINKK